MVPSLPQLDVTQGETPSMIGQRAFQGRRRFL